MYQGFISINLDTKNTTCVVSQTFDVPGFVEQAFMSKDGKNFAFIVAERLEEVYNLKAQKKFQKRLELMDLLSNSQKSNLITLKILAKTQIFYVHKFIIDIRAPKLLKFFIKSGPDVGCINLKKHHNSTVEELLQFLYLNISLTFKILKDEATQR